MEEDNGLVEEIVSHKPRCFHVMNNGYVEEEYVSFERPDEAMRQHLKPLFILGKAYGVGVNKLLVGGGETLNLRPHFLLKNIGKFDTNLRHHNMDLSNYEGKTSKALGVIQIDITVGNIVIPTLWLLRVEPMITD